MNKKTLDIGSTAYPPVVVYTKDDLRLPSFCRVFDNIFLFNVGLNASPLSEGSYIFGVDGCGVIDAEPILESSDFGQKYCGWVFDNFIEHLGKNLRGAAAVYAANYKNNSVVIAPDPLGNAVVYFYKGQRYQVASTSMRQLIKVLEHLGVHLYKSIDYALELLATQGGGFKPSSYSEVDALDVFQYLSINSHGLSAKTYKSKVDFFESNEDYEELINGAVEEIMENASSIAKVNYRKVCHITAGADSRLNCAALIASGVSDFFSFYCHQEAAKNELQLAEQFALDNKLKMTLHNNCGVAMAFTGYGEAAYNIMNSSAGMRAAGPHEAYYRMPGIVINGNYGEYFRSYYSNRFDAGLVDGKLLREVCWAPIISDPTNGLVRDAFVKSYENRVNEKIAQLDGLSLRPDAVGDFLFASVRNRYFVSHSTMEHSRYTKHFSALYSLKGLKASLRLPILYRKQGLVMFDIYQRIYPRSMRVPFDKDKFGHDVLKMREYVKPDYKFNDGKPLYDGFKSSAPYFHSLEGSDIPSPKEEHISRARRIGGVTAQQVAGEPIARAAARGLAQRIVRMPDSPFHRDRILEFVKRPANTRSQLRTLYWLHDIFNWYVDEK